MQTDIYKDHISTPIGKMEITANRSAVLSIYFVDVASKNKPNQITKLAKQQLLQYFDGSLTVFDMPIYLDGTEFQETVWQALTTIEYGQTGSYADIANVINNPKAVRAVGTANGKNPMTIVLPCHRIIGSDGSLTGYAGGVERKAWLLNHEANTLF